MESGNQVYNLLPSSQERLVAQVLYRNTYLRWATAPESERAGMSICMEELSALAGNRPPMSSSINMLWAVRFLESCGMDAPSLFFRSKRTDNAETAYSVGYMNKRHAFDVHVETEDATDTVHVGILADMDFVNDKEI